MPKLICECGYIHNLSDIPDDGFLVIKDKEYEQLLDLENKRYSISNPIQGSSEWDRLISADAEVTRITERLYECPDCKRIIWIKNDGTTRIYNLSEEFIRY